MSITKEKQNKAFRDLSYDNPMAAPRIEKIVVSSGIGSIKDKNKIKVVKDRLSKITGQNPSARPAKKSVAGFKIREGDTIGYQVTLRGRRMYDFLDRFLHIALPRSRDFRGIDAGAVDEMGNLTVGVREHTIFPETSDEDLKDVFGLSVTIVTSAKIREEAITLLKHLGVPFGKA